jgi:hypothetical protein
MRLHMSSTIFPTDLISSNRIHHAAMLYERYSVCKEQLELAKKNLEQAKKELIEYMKEQKL